MSHDKQFSYSDDILHIAGTGRGRCPKSMQGRKQGNDWKLRIGIETPFISQCSFDSNDGFMGESWSAVRLIHARIQIDEDRHEPEIQQEVSNSCHQSSTCGSQEWHQCNVLGYHSFLRLKSTLKGQNRKER
ncbi:hypothetical protein OPV22_016729 [Ensete ventricosum]|uniref:Uncharacterized protein n=1 Tax=Ensete ventricosum TaxID=4639 RepID=A0AAV8R0H0_ENSVE|nr:hypothetical protein OPV22_016729 [Ensete ventricosum]